tara:strand:+ start:459 stop:947 length:489 start_codon:yes stop_codon:yes gene_type:complete
MPTPTYTLIDSTTLATTAASVTFSGISATGKGDLVLACSMQNTVGNGSFYIQINGDTGSNYNWVRMYGTGSGSASSATSNTTQGAIGNFGASASNSLVQFSDYSATDKHKSILSRTNDANYLVSAYANRWASTSAITSFVVYPAGNAFTSGSTFHLYQLVSE